MGRNRCKYGYTQISRRRASMPAAGCKSIFTAEKNVFKPAGMTPVQPGEELPAGYANRIINK